MSSGRTWVLPHNCAERAVASEENGNSTGYPSNSARKSKNILCRPGCKSASFTLLKTVWNAHVFPSAYTHWFTVIQLILQMIWKEIHLSIIFRLSIVFTLYHLSACSLSLLEMLQDFFLAVLSARFKKIETILQGVNKGWRHRAGTEMRVQCWDPSGLPLKYR